MVNSLSPELVIGNACDEVAGELGQGAAHRAEDVCLLLFLHGILVGILLLLIGIFVIPEGELLASEVAPEFS